MADNGFISHSSQDKPVADAVCAALERASIRCWIAPRDVQPGRSFAGEITRAIQRSKVMVLIFSAHTNTSEQVLREVQLAAGTHRVTLSNPKFQIRQTFSVEIKGGETETRMLNFNKTQADED